MIGEDASVAAISRRPSRSCRYRHLPLRERHRRRPRRCSRSDAPRAERRRRDVRRAAPPARRIATRDRPLLGRLRAPGPQPAAPTRRARRWACSPCGRRCSARRRASDLILPDEAARRDARRRGRTRARAAGRRPSGPGQRVESRWTRSTRTRSSSRSRRPSRRGSSASPSLRSRTRRSSRVHLLFDRPLLRSPLAALLGSPAHWVFDRGALTGHAPPGGGQYLTVVSSGVPDLLEIRGQGARRPDGGRADRAARPGGAGLVARQPRAARDVRAAAREHRRSGAEPRPTARTSSAPARGPTPAGRRRWRARCAAACGGA